MKAAPLEITGPMRQASAGHIMVLPQEEGPALLATGSIQHMLAAVPDGWAKVEGQWFRIPSVCPYIETSDEGTSYCRLAEQPQRTNPPVPSVCRTTQGDCSCHDCPAKEGE